MDSLESAIAQLEDEDGWRVIAEEHPSWYALVEEAEVRGIEWGDEDD